MYIITKLHLNVLCNMFEWEWTVIMSFYHVGLCPYWHLAGCASFTDPTWIAVIIYLNISVNISLYSGSVWNSTGSVADVWLASHYSAIPDIPVLAFCCMQSRVVVSSCVNIVWIIVMALWHMATGHYLNSQYSIFICGTENL